MVLFNSTTFVALILIFTSMLGSVSAEAQTSGKSTAKKSIRRPGAIARYGLGFVTIPQTARLLGSGVGNGNYEVATETNGLVLSYDYEHRVARWMFVGGGGLGLVGVRAKSADASLDYSYSKDSSFIAMISGTAYYITSPSVRFGIGLKGIYGDFDLPTVDISGTTYKFDYGPTMKMFASADLNWQLSRQWMFTQSLMSPLSKQAGTGWLLAVKRTF